MLAAREVAFRGGMGLADSNINDSVGILWFQDETSASNKLSKLVERYHGVSFAWKSRDATQKYFRILAEMQQGEYAVYAGCACVFKDLQKKAKPAA